MGGVSDDEAWLKDGAFYENLLEEEKHGRAEDHLGEAARRVGSLGPCPFLGCPKTKTFSEERYRRHLAEVHTSRTPEMGCRSDASCKGFVTARRGDLVRHLVAVHAIGASKGAGYVDNLLRYPNRDSREKDCYYPRHLFFRWVPNSSKDRVRWAEEGEATTPVKTVAVAASSATPTQDERIEEAGKTLVSLAAETVEEEAVPDPSTPPRATSSPVVPLATTEEPLETSGEDTIPPETSRLFTDYYDRGTALIITGFNEAVKRTRKEALVEAEEAKKQCASLQQENKELREELGTAKAQVTKLQKESRRASRQLEKATEYREVEYQSLEKRLHKWNKWFIEATGISLHDWTGSRKELRQALASRADSEEED